MSLYETQKVISRFIARNTHFYRPPIQRISLPKAHLTLRGLLPLRRGTTSSLALHSALIRVPVSASQTLKYYESSGNVKIQTSLSTSRVRSEIHTSDKVQGDIHSASLKTTPRSSKELPT
jgi:hypothetical protein